MAVSRTIAKTLTVILVLQIQADGIALTAIGSPSQTSSDTYDINSKFDNIEAAASDEFDTGAPLVDRYFDKSILMLDEAIDNVAELYKSASLRRQRTHAGKVTRKTHRANLRKRYNGWLVRPRMFRSDLGKRSIRTPRERAEWLR